MIEDNGRGFDPASLARLPGGRGLGIIGMRERTAMVGGELEIESSPGRGTTVFAQVPIVETDARAAAAVPQGRLAPLS